MTTQKEIKLETSYTINGKIVEKNESFGGIDVYEDVNETKKDILYFVKDNTVVKIMEMGTDWNQTPEYAFINP